MNVNKEVARIKSVLAKAAADVAELPAEARTLFQEEQTWAAKHPVLYAVALLGVGAVLTLIAVAVVR